MNKSHGVLLLVVITSLAMPIKASAVEVNVGPGGINFDWNDNYYPYNNNPRNREYPYYQQPYNRENPYYQQPYNRGSYSVYYRYRNHNRWELQGTYRNPGEANRVASQLRNNGYDVRVEPNN